MDGGVAGTVVNRFVPMGTNASKTYQAQLIQAQGFLVPPTLVTSEPDEVLAFQAQYRRVIYKSISSVRSIVQELDAVAIARTRSYSIVSYSVSSFR